MDGKRPLLHLSARHPGSGRGSSAGGDAGSPTASPGEVPVGVEEVSAWRRCQGSEEPRNRSNRQVQVYVQLLAENDALPSNRSGPFDGNHSHVLAL